MVTPIYTPLLSAYRPTAQKPVGSGDDEQGKSPFGLPGTDEQPDGRQRRSQGEEIPLPRPATTRPLGGHYPVRPQGVQQGLSSVQDQRSGQKIQLDSILDDFTNTLNALGASDDLRHEVAAYLHVVQIQGNKPTPEVGFIKHTLRTAAGSMDKFITAALGEKSNVVKDWVDALLLQNIDYRTENKPHIALPLPESDETPVSARGNEPVHGLDKQRLKTLVQDAKGFYGEARYDDAHTLLDEGLAMLAGRDRPDLEARLLHLKGRFYDENQQADQALRAYEQAEHRFGVTGQTQKQAQTLYAMASILDERGNLPEAAQFYERVAHLDELHGDQASLARTLNDLGGVYLRNHAGDMAVDTFKKAYKAGEKASTDLLPDILSNLGAALRANGDYDTAAKAYQRSLKFSKQNRDRDGYINTLENLAGLYLESGDEERASQIREKLALLI